VFGPRQGWANELHRTGLIRMGRAGQTVPLPRSIGLAQGVAFYVGAIVGAGILVLPGITASIAGPAAIIGWLIDLAATIPIALTFAALASRNPDAGGVATFSRRAFGNAWGSIIGWFYLVASIVGQTILALTGAHYLSQALNLGYGGVVILAAITLVAGAGLNLRGLVASGWAQIGISTAVVVTVALAITVGASQTRAEHFVPFAPHGIVAVGQVAIIAYVACFGWEVVTQLAPEFRDPARDILRATLISLLLITALYLGVVAVTIGTGIASDIEGGRVAVARLYALAFGTAAGQIVGVVGFLITAGALNTYVAATSRLAYALARDGDLPASLAALMDGVPARAVVAVAGASGLVLLAAVLTSLDVESLFLVPSVLSLVANVVAMAAGFALLRGWPRRLALSGLALCGLLVPFASAGAAIPIVVAAVAFGFRRWRGRPAANH
jgi:amino acid efflux transporter